MRIIQASYYGLAIGRNSKGRNVIYATDGGRDASTDNNQIDMFDGNFKYLGSFTDPDIPSNFPPSWERLAFKTLTISLRILRGVWRQ